MVAQVLLGICHPLLSSGRAKHTEFVDCAAARVKNVDSHPCSPCQWSSSQMLIVKKFSLQKCHHCRSATFRSRGLQCLCRFQQEGVEACLRRDGRCLLADEMGCGKTVQARLITGPYPSAEWELPDLYPSCTSWRAVLDDPFNIHLTHMMGTSVPSLSVAMKSRPCKWDPALCLDKERSR